MGMIKHKPLSATRNDEYLFTFKFTMAAGASPTVFSPAYGTDVLTLARTAAGTFTITFQESKKPYDLHFGSAQILGDQPGWHAKVVSYVASTGVLTVKVYDEDDVSGIQAAADSTKVVQLMCVFTRSSVTGII